MIAMSCLGTRTAYPKGGVCLIMAKTATNQEFRQRLEQERRRLLDELQGMADQRNQREDSTTDYEHYTNHDADIATETYETEKNLALEDNLRRQLAMTEAALVKLDEGTYGICANCGRPIDPERLDALPHVTVCIDCKRLQEARR
jgi:DnaK suppressor protein